MDRYIAFLERVYPRRCCDDNEAVSLGMVQDIDMTIVHNNHCCRVCQDYRGQNVEHNHEGPAPCENSTEARSSTTSPFGGEHPRQKQGGKRSRRHARYDGAKIVTRIMDRALQPTWGILTGMRGNSAFRRVSHDLSRDNAARNCGPGYVLWKAMRSVPDEVWDGPFELIGDSGGGRKTTYYPTK
mmetsp:Transcript_28154/g.67803  ORF Transcript_28154/g.67803 Transcript_28154/m.67803 type:complete len:184 (+) Transcript_28154:1-552(+)